jgi:transcriptional regulator with XRE-family HTH domain
MTDVRHWTGREARALRLALRLSVRAFAEQLGVATRTVSKWEAGGIATVPRPDSQAILDTALARADAAAQKRFALLCPPDERSARSAERARLPVGSTDHVDEILVHLRDQWHALVRTDNLLGPRFALPGVLDQIAIIEELLPMTSGAHRRELVALAATYAESAAWLNEDAGQMPAAAHWVGRAMEWAHEAGDGRLLAWTLFRRSQHAASERDAQRALGLARAASRDADSLSPPMRAAILQQEAHGHALEGNELVAHRTLDHALRWAADDTTGDARGGHGSFCTAAYLELQRAACWSALGRPERAIQHFEEVLPTLPAVYHRDRGVAFGRLAHACASTGDAEPAADRGRQALDIARSSGSVRTEQAVVQLGRRLTDHYRLAAVRSLLHELGAVA